MSTTTTKVVNLYKNKYTVYIGRAGKGKSGYFGNPVARLRGRLLSIGYHLTKSHNISVLKESK